MPTCNDWKDRKGCGQEIKWVPKPNGPGKMMANLDGSKHECGNSIPATQQVQVHSQAEKYMGKLVSGAVQTPLDNVHSMLVDVRDQISSVNNNVMTLLNEFRDLNVNVTDWVKGMHIKGKVDYKKDDNAPNLEDKINKNTTDLEGLCESIFKLRELMEAVLIQKGFVNAGELYKPKEEVKLDNT